VDKLADADDLEKALKISTEFKPSVALVNYQLRKSNAILSLNVQQESPTTDILFVSMQESWIAWPLPFSRREGIRCSNPIRRIDHRRRECAAFRLRLLLPPDCLDVCKKHTRATRKVRITNLSSRELES